jgi:F-type H+-transporting ATPase subunit epsilon
MATDKLLQCVIVTPERAILDERADMIILPMVDGELGVQFGRAALVGRLGKGELRLKRGADTRRLRVEGGFAQVRANVVTVLTARVTESHAPAPTPAAEH